MLTILSRDSPSSKSCALIYVTGEMDLLGETDPPRETVLPVGKSVLPGLSRQIGSGTIFEAIYGTF